MAAARARPVAEAEKSVFPRAPRRALEGLQGFRGRGGAGERRAGPLDA